MSTESSRACPSPGVDGRLELASEVAVDTAVADRVLGDVDAVVHNRHAVEPICTASAWISREREYHEH